MSQKIDPQAVYNLKIVLILFLDLKSSTGAGESMGFAWGIHGFE